MRFDKAEVGDLLKRARAALRSLETWYPEGRNFGLYSNGWGHLRAVADVWGNFGVWLSAERYIGGLEAAYVEYIRRPKWRKIHSTDVFQVIAGNRLAPEDDEATFSSRTRT